MEEQRGLKCNYAGNWKLKNLPKEDYLEKFELYNFRGKSLVFAKTVLPILFAGMFTAFFNLFFLWLTLFYFFELSYHFLFQREYLFLKNEIETRKTYFRKKKETISRIKYFRFRQGAKTNFIVMDVLYHDIEGKEILKRININTSEESYNILNWAKENKIKCLMECDMSNLMNEKQFNRFIKL